MRPLDANEWAMVGATAAALAALMLAIVLAGSMMD